MAACVAALGVDLGPADELATFHYEDQTMHSPDLVTRFRYIARRNVQHQCWGWKDPVGEHSVREVMFALRSPRVVVVFRDLLATVQAELRYDVVNGITGRSFDAVADRTLEWWRRNLEFVRFTGVPTLFVSYERAMLHPDLFVGELAGFLGVDSAERLVDAELCVGRDGGYMVGAMAGCE